MRNNNIFIILVSFILVTIRISSVHAADQYSFVEDKFSNLYLAISSELLDESTKIRRMNSTFNQTFFTSDGGRINPPYDCNGIKAIHDDLNTLKIRLPEIRAKVEIMDKEFQQVLNVGSQKMKDHATEMMESINDSYSEVADGYQSKKQIMLVPTVMSKGRCVSEGVKF